MSSISEPVIRVDATAKSLGTARYLGDVDMPGVQWARLLLSSEPHARIKSIELPVLPEGYTVVDHRDVPGANRVPIITDTWPLFPVDTVCHIGQPILVIVGRDLDVLDRLIRGCRVAYEPLKPILGIDEALAAGEEARFVTYSLDRGDWQAGPSDLCETIETTAQEHVYMEPQAMAAYPERKRMTIAGSMQCPYFVRNAVSAILGVPGEQVRVIQSTTGGGFGGKEDYPSLLGGLVAVAARKIGAPVRIVLDRAEDMVITTKRHPTRIEFASRLHPPAGGDAAPGVAATTVTIDLDGGAFEGLSATVLQRAMFSATGVYRIPAASVDGRAHRTNVVPFGAFRGFGSPQAFFAVEMHMSHLARLCGEDPLTFKRRHLLRQGDLTITGGTLRDPILMDEMIDALVAESDYERKAAEYASNAAGLSMAAQPATATVRRGIGVSLFSHGCGFTGNGERDIIRARVALNLEDDGRVTILAANVEMGQGAETTLRKIVADTMALPLERVDYSEPDTDRVPDSGPTVASRTVMVVGGLLQKAAVELKERIEAAGPNSLAPGERRVEATYVQPPEIEWDQETFSGDAYPAFSWGVNIVEVEVDCLTWSVTPLEIWTAYDIGRAIDTRIVEGQVHGGVVQGLGYALCEELQFKAGRPMQATMTDYVIPGSLDIPPIHVRLFDNPYHNGPFGAKGAGEIPLTGVAPAVADAVERAIGQSVYRIPLTPEYVRSRAAVHNRGTESEPGDNHDTD